jgi:hypothetical protein
MAQFVGGPSDGQNLPVDPKFIKKIRLPEPESDAGILVDALVIDTRTVDRVDWPHKYELDATVDPPVYRFVGEWAQ